MFFSTQAQTRSPHEERVVIAVEFQLRINGKEHIPDDSHNNQEASRRDQQQAGLIRHHPQGWQEKADKEGDNGPPIPRTRRRGR